VNNAAARRF